MRPVTEFLEWLATLPADFVFLLSIPFLVAAAGLLADRSARAADRRRHEPQRGATRIERPVG